DQQHRDRGPHAAFFRLGLGAVVDRGAGVLNGLLESAEDLGRLHRAVAVGEAVDYLAMFVNCITDFVDGDRGGDFAGVVPAHAVGDDEQAELLVDEVVVLIVIALPTYVSRSRKGELHQLNDRTAATARSTNPVGYRRLSGSQPPRIPGASSRSTRSRMTSKDW